MWRHFVLLGVIELYRLVVFDDMTLIFVFPIALLLFVLSNSKVWILIDFSNRFVICVFYSYLWYVFYLSLVDSIK